MKLAWQIASKQVCRLHGARLISHTQMHIWCQEEITCNKYHFPGSEMQMMDLPRRKSARQTPTKQVLNCPHTMNVGRYQLYFLPFELIKYHKHKRCLFVSKWQSSQAWNPWHHSRVGITTSRSSSSGFGGKLEKNICKFSQYSQY